MSADTDVGARLLCAAARLDVLWSDPGAPLDHDGHAIISGAAHMARGMGLPLSCLDATLLVLWQEGAAFRGRLWGDGAFVGRYRDGRGFRLVRVSFAHNAPAYLSYTFDADRREVYLRKTDEGLHTVQTREVLTGAETVVRDETRRGLDPVQVEFPIETFDLAMGLSDGIETCGLPVEVAVGQLLAIPSFEGRFLVRRLKRFLKRHRAAGGDVEDDLFAVALAEPDAPPNAEQAPEGVS